MLIATLNANGMRACLRNGFDKWLHKRKPDILCLQEIRATKDDLAKWFETLTGWHVYWHPAKRPGYAGVAILSRKKPKKVSHEFKHQIFDDEGRWLLADYGNLVVVSLYLPSGSHDAKRQLIKYKCMDLLANKMQKLRTKHKRIVIAGDYNIAHTKLDIRNWQSNQKNSGFLPQEREWLTKLLSTNWVDIYRHLHPKAEQYTWWSQRSGARARNVGWRIDYQLATKAQAKLAHKVQIDKDPYLSDHAPLLVHYKS